MNLDKINEKMNTSDFYQMKEGSNKMRIMTDFTEVKTINRNQKYAGIVSEDNQEQSGDSIRTQGWAWAIIRGDKTKEIEDELAIVKFGRKILGQLVALKNNPEYAFDSMPVPYDIDVQTKDAGEMSVVYTVVPARQNTEVAEKEMEKLNKKKTVEEIIKSMIDKQDGKNQDTGYGSFDQKTEYPKDVAPADKF